MPRILRHILSSFIVLGVFGTSSTAQEVPEGASDPDEERRYGRYYNGSFVDVSARGSYERVASSPLHGWSWDIGLRQAFPMHLLDTRIAYGEERYTRRDGDPGGDFVVRSVDLTTAFHPLYLALLYSSRWGYLVASWYVEAGLGGHYSTFGSDLNDLGLRLHLGSGFDVPLTDPDRGWSLWLNFVYRFTWSDFDTSAMDEVNLHHHSFFSGISARFNGLLF